MKKLNELLASNKVVAYGFEAFKGLSERSNTEGEPIVVSTLSAAVMAGMGVNSYYAPVIARNTVYNTTDDVIQADLNVNLVRVEAVPNVPDNAPVIIVSRHSGTVELLEEKYPNHITLSEINPDMIKGKDVVGALPPHLIQYARSFRAVAIKDFDYKKEQDLSGDELKERMIFTDTVRVTVE